MNSNRFRTGDPPEPLWWLYQRIVEDRLEPEGETFNFSTVVFECPVEATMTWELSDRDFDRITDGMGMFIDSNDEVDLVDFLDDRMSNNKELLVEDKRLLIRSLVAHELGLGNLNYNPQQPGDYSEDHRIVDRVMLNRLHLDRVEKWFFDVPKEKEINAAMVDD